MSSNKDEPKSGFQSTKKQYGTFLGMFSNRFRKTKRTPKHSSSSDNPQFDSTAGDSNTDELTPHSEESMRAQQQLLASCVAQSEIEVLQAESWEFKLSACMETIENSKVSLMPEETPPLHGVRLGVLQSIRDKLVNIHAPSCQLDHSHSDVCNIWTNKKVYNLLQKFTSSEQCSVASLLSRYPVETSTTSALLHPFLGGNVDDVTSVANVFVSHTWSTSFAIFVESLEYHVADTKNTLTPETAYFWIDGLILNQHAPRASESFAGVFLNCTKEIDEVVCVLESWRNPVALARVWCLWEIMGAMLHEKPFSILFTKSEQEQVVHTLIHDFHSITNALYNIDASNAKATVESDKAMIMDEIDKMPKGILGVNQTILVPMRQWIAETCERKLDELRVSAPESSDTIMLMSNLSMLYDTLGRYEEAEPLCLEVLQLSKRLYGDEDPETLNAMYSHAHLCQLQGRNKVAAVIFSEILRINQRVQGMEHPDTISSLISLAQVQETNETLDEAERSYDEALRLSIKVFGKEHDSTLALMGNCVMLYMRRGRFKEAETMAEEVLLVRNRTLDTSHPSKLVALSNLALIYKSQGNFAKAEPMYLEILSFRKRALGEEHPETLTAMSNLALLYQAQGRYQEAESLISETYESSVRTLGEHHSDTLECMNSFAAIYQAQGRLADAEQMFRKCLKLMRQELGSEHHTTIAAINNLGLLYLTTQRFGEAEPLLLEALELNNKYVGEKNTNTATFMRNIALLYISQRRLQEAEAMCLQVLSLMKQLFGEESRETLNAMVSLSQVKFWQRQFNDAELLQEEVLQLQKKYLGEDHPDTIGSMGNLAHYYYAHGRLEEAQILCAATVELSQTILGNEHPLTQAFRSKLSQVSDTNPNPEDE